MTTSCKFSRIFRFSAVVVLASGVLCPVVLAQGPVPDAPVPFVQPASPVVIAPSRAGSEHRFWDKENSVLFAASAATSAADFAVTRAILQNGGREMNPTVRLFGRSTLGLATNFAGETVGVIGVSYFLHRTGHHKLERIFTMVNIGSSAGAVTYDLVQR
jgi:hypothetical protein